ncbi:MAG: alpha/beta fold hydrolase [Planctomycetes bacterium]|nr:alpha/beta fold hydrolase [Planctomycetota bacterium]
MNQHALPRALSRLLVLVIALLACVGAARAAELAEREPSASAPTQRDFVWTARNGLRFAWRLPRDYSASQPVHLTLICHGTGLDHRWGPANHPVETFRPHDIVVSLDGPSPAKDSRLFLDGDDDVERVAEFLAEMRERFAVRSVFLYGHSQGGFFVAHYAGARPKDVAGVVAHASGMWAQSKSSKASHGVAYSFLHGTLDPVVPYSQSVGARDFLVKGGFPRVKLRRLERYNHWPNAVRAGEELDWCQGMTTTSAAEALECAERILAAKAPDEYQWSTAVGFAGARAVLARLVGKGVEPLAEVDAASLARARELLDALEREGAAHAAALRKALGKNKTLALDGGAWLGHLLALREDFRGVESVEALVGELGLERAQERHLDGVRALEKAWYGSLPDAEKYAAMLAALGEGYLYEGYGPELAETLEQWRAGEKRLEISKKVSKSYETYERWKQGWSEGLEAYAKLWRKWKLPAR